MGLSHQEELNMQDLKNEIEKQTQEKKDNQKGTPDKNNTQSNLNDF